MLGPVMVDIVHQTYMQPRAALDVAHYKVRDFYSPQH